MSISLVTKGYIAQGGASGTISVVIDTTIDREERLTALNRETRLVTVERCGE